MNETVQVVDNHEVFTADRSQTDLTEVHQRGAWKLKALVRPIYVNIASDSLTTDTAQSVVQNSRLGCTWLESETNVVSNKQLKLTIVTSKNNFNFLSAHQ